jgi:hypothetical protein
MGHSFFQLGYYNHCTISFDVLLPGMLLNFRNGTSDNTTASLRHIQPGLSGVMLSIAVQLSSGFVINAEIIPSSKLPSFVHFTSITVSFDIINK